MLFQWKVSKADRAARTQVRNSSHVVEVRPPKYTLSFWESLQNFLVKLGFLNINKNSFQCSKKFKFILREILLCINEVWYKFDDKVSCYSFTDTAKHETPGSEIKDSWLEQYEWPECHFSSIALKPHSPRVMQGERADDISTHWRLHRRNGTLSWGTKSFIMGTLCARPLF